MDERMVLRDDNGRVFVARKTVAGVYKLSPRIEISYKDLTEKNLYTIVRERGGCCDDDKTHAIYSASAYAKDLRYGSIANIDYDASYIKMCKFNPRQRNQFLNSIVNFLNCSAGQGEEIFYALEEPICGEPEDE